MKKLFAMIAALAISLPVFAGGYPWGFQETLTHADLNAAFAARATFSCGTLGKYDTLIGNGGADGGDICPVLPGLSGQVLTSNGPNAAPSYETLNTLSTANYGTSVNDPGTGKLEASFPIQTITGFSHPFSTPDFFQKTRRSNGGLAMSDTFPAPTMTGVHHGTIIDVANVDSAGAITITAASGTTISGGASYVLYPGRAVTWSYDAPNSAWRPLNNSTSALLFSGTAATASQLVGGSATPGLSSAISIGNCLTLTSGTLAYTNGCGASAAVTSVGLVMPSIFSVSGSPITSAGTGIGTFTVTYNNFAQNGFMAGPSTGGAGAPTVRAIVAGDLPTATSGAKGIVQTDGSTITNTSGTISCTTATSSQIGCLKPDNATITVSSGTASCATATTSQAGCLKPDGSTITISSGVISAAATGAPLNYISGFGLSNDATTATTVLDIAAGFAADSTNSVTINSAGTAWKKTTSTFSAGNGNGGLGSGLTLAANTNYHVFAIICTGAFDIYFDTSITAANKPACASSFRYVGDFRTQTGNTNIYTFYQFGQKIIYGTAITDVAATNTSITAYTASVPSGVSVFPIQRVGISSGAAVAVTCSFYPLGGSGSVPVDGLVVAESSTAAIWIQIQTTTNTSGQLAYVSSSTNVCNAVTLGYINPHLAPNF